MMYHSSSPWVDDLTIHETVKDYVMRFFNNKILGSEWLRLNKIMLQYQLEAFSSFDGKQEIILLKKNFQEFISTRSVATGHYY